MSKQPDDMTLMSPAVMMAMNFVPANSLSEKTVVRGHGCDRECTLKQCLMTERPNATRSCFRRGEIDYFALVTVAVRRERTLGSLDCSLPRSRQRGVTDSVVCGNFGL